MMSMHNAKKLKRLKRAKKSRIKMKELKVIRLVVNRSNKNMYAQVISSESSSDKVLVSASTLDKEFKSNNSSATVNNINTATELGKLVAKRAIDKGVKTVSFDRSGFKYHGRIKALADAAREEGLQF